LSGGDLPCVHVASPVNFDSLQTSGSTEKAFVDRLS
jgi:hypothetical protein